MFLTFETPINLTSYGGNPSPKLVEQLSIIHEADKGELVQYYIDPDNVVPADKNAFAIGVFNPATEQYEYFEYPELLWNAPKRRITTRKVDRLGLKAFPGVGACAFYKLAYQARSRIVIPVNTRQKLYPAPIQTVTVLSDKIHLEFTSPEDVTYQCFRVIFRCGNYAEEYISYDPAIDCPLPKMNGNYVAMAQGYISEGEEASELSTEFAFVVSVPGQSDTPPATYTPGELPKVTSSDKGKFLMVDDEAAWSAIKFASIDEPTHHQLLRYNGDTHTWENYTSMVPDAAESAAHIISVYVDNGQQIRVEVDSKLRDLVSTAYVFIEDDQGNTQAIQSTNVLSSLALQINTTGALPQTFYVTLLKEAFRSPQNDAGPFEVTLPALNLQEFVDSTAGMTLVAFSSDDGSSTLNLPASFKWPFNNLERIASLVISGNSWVGLGSSSEHVKVNRRDNYIQQYYWSYVTGHTLDFVKLRWEGWSPYNSRSDPYKFIWELFLLSNGDAFLHLVRKGSSTNWSGAFTFNGAAYTLSEANADVSFYRVNPAGTAAADWRVENAMYVEGS